MEFGVCTGFSRAQSLVGAADYVEENVQKLLVGNNDEAAFAASTEGTSKCPLPIPVANCFIPGSLKCVGPDRDMDELLGYCQNVFRRAETVGIETIVFGSGGARSIPEGTTEGQAIAQFTELCREIAPIAGAYGIMIVIEPLCDCNLINYLWEGAKIVEAVDHPNLKLLADFFHMLRFGDAPQDIATFGEHLRHIHIAEPANRTPPGVEPYDFSPFFDALGEAGYNGRISLECSWGDDLAAEAAAGIVCLREMLVIA